MLRGYFLGGFRLCAGDVVIDGLNTRKSRSLIAYLMLNPGRTFGREVLAETIWGEGRAGDTMKALRQELWLIRKAFREAGLAPEEHFALEGEDLGVTGTPWVDAAAFEAALDAPASNGSANGAAVANGGPSTKTGTPAGPNPPLDAPGARRLEAVVAHYAGDLLPGLYDDWCLLPREILRDRYIIAVERLMHHHAARADWPAAIIHAKRLLDADPLLEHIHRDLMQFHYARGDRPAALKQFASCKRLLREQLTIDPMEDTVCLYEAIKEEVQNRVVWDLSNGGRISQRSQKRTLWSQCDTKSTLRTIRSALNNVRSQIDVIIKNLGACE